MPATPPASFQFAKKAAAAAAILLTVAAAWYVLSPVAPPPPKSAEPTAPLTEPSEASTLPPPSFAPEPVAQEPAPPEPAPPQEPAPSLPEGPPLWERRIDEALRSPVEHSAIARNLLQQVPSMPKEGQFAAAQHIANLISDEDYAQVIPYIQNLKLDQGFQELMVAESLNRPDFVKLPVLLTAARTPAHPMAQTALSTLTVLLDANYGSDWGRWEAAVKEALAPK